MFHYFVYFFQNNYELRRNIRTRDPAYEVIDPDYRLIHHEYELIGSEYASVHTEENLYEEINL